MAAQKAFLQSMVDSWEMVPFVSNSLSNVDSVSQVSTLEESQRSDPNCPLRIATSKKSKKISIGNSKKEKATKLESKKKSKKENSKKHKKRNKKKEEGH